MRTISARLALTALTVAAAIVVVMPAGGAGAADAPCQRTYSSGTVNKAIPDSYYTSDRIDVPEDGLVVSDVDVALNIHHSFDADLQLALLSVPVSSARS